MRYLPGYTPYVYTPKLSEQGRYKNCPSSFSSFILSTGLHDTSSVIFTCAEKKLEILPYLLV